ncbi:reprolysin-like metallopeptidase [Bizionia echini]|uniref:zinc-dependent metalloprotease n=1 Tax=Bizionia echini TaxID=649333 RepID=UPI0030DA758B
MKKFYLKFGLTFLTIVLSMSLYGQNRNSIWQKVNKNDIRTTNLAERETMPEKAEYFQLDLNQLKQQLTQAPDRNEFSGESNLIINFPNAQGELEGYRVKEASILAPELQSQVPNIRSYIGVSISNPSDVIRFSVTPKGLHTMTLSSERGTQYIDPYTKDSNIYLSYSRRDVSQENRRFECAVEEEGLQVNNNSQDIEALRNANDGQIRNFRLALACTVEYAEFHWLAAGLTAADSEADKKNAVLAAMVVTMTRVNALYERELSLNMTIIANNLDIVFIDADTYTNDSGSAMLNQNQTVLTSIIGGANYDIGHVFSTGGGGVAILNSPCTPNNKAKGVTGLPNPVGDIFDYEYVAHEMGHQYGAPHTWNGDAGGCTPGQRSSSNAYEPGSGSTIMGYAGLCGVQNVQTFTDIYFHQKSLQMIWSNITNGNSICASLSGSGNNAPTARAGANYTIPISTPYKLSATSTDNDGTESHTYTWEQYDLGPSGVPNETTATGPLVRSIEGTTNPTRYIPNLPDLLQQGGSTQWERLVSIARSISFRVTVRDNDPRGGQTATDLMVANTVTAAGPFIVTSQDTPGTSWTQGETETITWDVAGTTSNGVDTANVNILLSTDGGLTYDTVLASNVPNNGSYDVVVPNVVAPFCRVMVEAVGNIFFNINSADFAVGVTVTETCNNYESGNIALPIPDGLGTTSPQQGQPLFSSIEVTEDVVIDNNITFNVDISHTFIGDFLIQIQHPDVATNNAFVNVYAGGCGNNQDFNVTFDSNGSPIVCGSPTIGTYAPANSMDIFNGLNSAGTWRVAVVDFFQGDTGVLNDWSIEICTTSLSTAEFESLDDLTVYPNPNNGDFNVKFNSTSNNDVIIEVLDIRGRKVFENSYRNTGIFNQSINLDNVQSGMYLLNISEGNRKVTKKIIIN